MSRTTIVITPGLALAATLPAVPAQAQSIRTFVSTAGSDSNPCSLASPCRHFSAAVAATAVGGEVDALDPGAYGSFTISQAISIEGQGWSYVAPPNNGTAITINASSGDVNIRGVSLNGVGATSTNGIQFNSGTTLNVQNSVIRNFTGNGIAFEPTASITSQPSVSNTLVSDNGNQGIYVYLVGSGGVVNDVLDHVVMENTSNGGLYVVSTAPTVNLTVSDSVSANNGFGIYSFSGGGTQVSVMVRNSPIANNGLYGLDAIGTGATVRITRST